jgi:CRISPR-associated protein Csd1
MILTKLKEFAEEQMTLPPEMYGEISVRWLIDLDSDGLLKGWVPLGGNSKTDKDGIKIFTPQVPTKGSAIRPKLLADNGEYVLGISKSSASKLERVRECHKQFKDLVYLCSEQTQDRSLIAVAIFLNNWNPENNQKELPKDFDANKNMTFRVDGVIPADVNSNLKIIQKFWFGYISNSTILPEEPKTMCLVSGQPCEALQRMPFQINGIPGKRPSTSLVSANEDPFTSYGLKNSLTSPISRDAAEKFAKALNYLLADDRHRMYIGSTAYVFWTKEKTEFNPISLFKNPDVEDVKNLLASPFSASQMYGVESQEFYALSLTASMARSVVRDWLETTIDRVHGNLQQWFRNQKIINNDGEIGKPLGLYALAASVYRDPVKEMQSTVPTALIRHALHGSRLADDLLVKLVRRNRAEQDITYPRAVFIKLILISQGKIAMSEMESLNLNPKLEGQEKAAYHCGRLLAELEAVQRSALGNINASLVDRYYGAASSTPAKAFSPLLRGVQSHLGKLRKNAPGINKLREEQLEEIMSHFNEGKLPNTLNVGSQAIFALGYYHQRAANRAAMNAAKVAKALKANS